MSVLTLLGQTGEDKLQVMCDFNSQETNSSRHYLNNVFQTEVTYRPAHFFMKIKTNEKSLI